MAVAGGSRTYLCKAERATSWFVHAPEARKGLLDQTRTCARARGGFISSFYRIDAGARAEDCMELVIVFISSFYRVDAEARRGLYRARIVLTREREENYTEHVSYRIRVGARG